MYSRSIWGTFFDAGAVPAISTSLWIKNTSKFGGILFLSDSLICAISLHSYYEYVFIADPNMTSKNASHFTIWVDEAGRGAWAGPVVAAACALQVGFIYSFSPLLADSKKLSPKKREMIFGMIQEAISSGTCFWGVSIISSEIIDQVGIREANRLAMEQAIHIVKNQINSQYDLIQIDGRDNYRFRGIESNQLQYIVRGDSFIPEIQAASILAKVSRDHLMMDLAKKYSNYGLEKHKWYGTRLHEKLLLEHRPSDIHRKTYVPIRKLLIEWGGNYEI